MTSEYLVKAGYGWAIKKASEASYGVESQVTGVILHRAPAAAIPDVKLMKIFDDGAVLAELPRYQAFTPAAIALARAKVNFQEIAANKGPILVTIIVNKGHQPTGIQSLFTQPIMTDPGFERIGFVVNTTQLSETLRRLDNPQIKIEHIYDY
jgi:hypothetical protein